MEISECQQGIIASNDSIIDSPMNPTQLIYESSEPKREKKTIYI